MTDQSKPTTDMPDEHFIICAKTNDCSMYPEEIRPIKKSINGTEIKFYPEIIGHGCKIVNSDQRQDILVLISMGFSHKMENGEHVISGYGKEYRHTDLLCIGSRVQRDFLVPAAPTGDKAQVHMASIDVNGNVEHSTLTVDIETPKEPKSSPETDKAEIAYWEFDARHKGYGEYKLRPQSERDAFKAVYRQSLQENTAPAPKPLGRPAGVTLEKAQEMWSYISNQVEHPDYDAAFMNKFRREIKNMIAVLCVAPTTKGDE